MSDPLVSAELDVKAVEREQRRLAKLTGAPLTDKLNKGTLAALRLLVPNVRTEAPRGPTGNLARKVSARKARSGVGALLGSTAPHRHLVTRPHRIVTPGGHDTGRRTTGNDFVDRAAAPRLDKALEEVQRELFAE